VPVRFLITFAYDLRRHQLTGGPDWLDSARFDIVAKPERPVPDGPEGNDLLRRMMQALLAERFGLVIHRETKEMPVYVLVLAKNGPKLTSAASGSRGPSIRMGRGQLQAQKAKAQMLANLLSNQLGRNVIDRTGLTDDYDFKLEWTPDISQPPDPGEKGFGEGPEKAPTDPGGPSLFSAVQEQLGLKLEPQKGSVETVVIDRVEKPTEN
jgi:uncharacterized protein (TIGR03435 family)